MSVTQLRTDRPAYVLDHYLEDCMREEVAATGQTPEQITHDALLDYFEAEAMAWGKPRTPTISRLIASLQESVRVAQEWIDSYAATGASGF